MGNLLPNDSAAQNLKDQNFLGKDSMVGQDQLAPVATQEDSKVKNLPCWAEEDILGEMCDE
jgi:hypothetical protein